MKREPNSYTCSKAVIFSPSHLLAHVNRLLQFCGTTKIYIIFFADLTKKIGLILIHAHWTAVVGLAVVIFLFDNLREKRSVFRTK